MRHGRALSAPLLSNASAAASSLRAVAALKRHRKVQLEERRRLAGLWEEGGLVVPNRTGGFMSHYALTGSIKRVLQRATLPAVRFHDLRHTCATILLSRGIRMKLVQELLGHATISITLVTYRYVLPGMDDALG